VTGAGLTARRRTGLCFCTAFRTRRRRAAPQWISAVIHHPRSPRVLSYFDHHRGASAAPVAVTDISSHYRRGRRLKPVWASRLILTERMIIGEFCCAAEVIVVGAPVAHSFRHHVRFAAICPQPDGYGALAVKLILDGPSVAGRRRTEGHQHRRRRCLPACPRSGRHEVTVCTGPPTSSPTG
jgi:hypothetical protein